MSLDPSKSSPIHKALDRAAGQFQQGDRAAGVDSLKDAVVSAQSSDPETQHVTWSAVAKLVHGNTVPQSAELSAGKGSYRSGGGKGSTVPSLAASDGKGGTVPSLAASDGKGSTVPSPAASDGKGSVPSTPVGDGKGGGTVGGSSGSGPGFWRRLFGGGGK